MAIATPTAMGVSDKELSSEPRSSSPPTGNAYEAYAPKAMGTYRAHEVGTEGASPDPDSSSGRAASVNGEAVIELEAVRQSRRGVFAYIRTRDFWIVLVLGQVLSLCLTATNTFSTLLVNEGTSIPAFQTLFNYVLLALIYVPYTIFKYGPKAYGSFLWRWGWKYLILSFCDVLGNYFTVLAYRYTTILSAQLINFWAIVLVVLISFAFLKVRYHPAQIVGIIVCIGGLGILIGSDHITGASYQPGVSKGDQIKGDLFALVGATFYGLANVAEEYLVSKRPLYETVGMLGAWGIIINGTVAAIFDRSSFKTAVWDGKVGGYLTGYTLSLALFYSVGPIVFRMGSAAFFNISLLTSNFWGTVIGIHVFGYSIHFMYPIAFVCIVGGLIVYFIGKQVYGEAFKPWLGRNQEKGSDGIGTARRRAERPDAFV